MTDVGVWPITLSGTGGVQNYFALIIMMTSQCVACNNHVIRLKVKFTDCTCTLCMNGTLRVKMGEKHLIAELILIYLFIYFVPFCGKVKLSKY